MNVHFFSFHKMNIYIFDPFIGVDYDIHSELCSCVPHVSIFNYFLPISLFCPIRSLDFEYDTHLELCPAFIIPMDGSPFPFLPNISYILSAHLISIVVLIPSSTLILPMDILPPLLLPNIYTLLTSYFLHLIPTIPQILKSIFNPVFFFLFYISSFITKTSIEISIFLFMFSA